MDENKFLPVAELDVPISRKSQPRLGITNEFRVK